MTWDSDCPCNDPPVAVTTNQPCQRCTDHREHCPQHPCPNGNLARLKTMVEENGLAGLLNVPLDPNKPRPEYNYVERRAAMLRLILQQGDPNAGSTIGLGQQFGVSHDTIWKDRKRVCQLLGERLGEGARGQLMAGFQSALQDLEGRDRVYALKEYAALLMDLGVLERVPEEHVLDTNVAPSDAFEAYLQEKYVADDEEDAG